VPFSPTFHIALAQPRHKSKRVRYSAPSIQFIPPLAPVIIQVPNQRTDSTYFIPPGSTQSSRDSSPTAELRPNLEHHAHAAPYVAVDPFRLTPTPSIMDSGLPLAYEYTSGISAPVMVYPVKRPGSLSLIFDVVPRQLYLHFLLRLPYLYFSRVTRIFEEADMSMLEIKEMAVADLPQLQYTFIYFPHRMDMGPHMSNLKASWEGFIDSLLKEWKTLNIISALLLSYVLHFGRLPRVLRLPVSNSAILTILQFQGVGADPLTRNCALSSLICALMSLLYGCMYIIRFGTMRRPHKAAEWALVRASARCNM